MVNRIRRPPPPHRYAAGGISDGFWDDVLAGLRNAFREERYAEGLCIAVAQVGEKLRAHFPFRRDDRDELPNDVSIG